MTIEQLRAGIEQVANLPAGEATYEVEKGRDATNDQAVWVYVTLQHWPEFAVRQQLRNEIDDYVHRLEGVDYVYVYFQDAAEVAALKTSARK